ncbi:hypothetical protein GGS23DRAFT_563230 [Durotheca rogersii]|uniref:uncharacterized protein n=1 Tax=Durotheca rogersii TaxID=419775 RepID=UPI0022208CDD|nr:uncharacterized protein GGS23DRAFT_563230 [Durotheca rogersii]KAI5864173.1 hypothetical protein GGS23DRAFT_563230 [Durotheca rogersii]
MSAPFPSPFTGNASWVPSNVSYYPVSIAFTGIDACLPAYAPPMPVRSATGQLLVVSRRDVCHLPLCMHLLGMYLLYIYAYLLPPRPIGIGISMLG